MLKQEINLQVISIIGASGFIGHHLLSLLAEKDNLEIRVLVYRQKPHISERGNVRLVEGSLLHPETLEQLLEPGCLVINLVYLAAGTAQENLDAMDNLARACANRGIKRLVHCSTAVVVGELVADIVDEGSPCRPRTAYEQTKLAMESRLLSHASRRFEVAILRPTAVFGARGKNLIKLADSLTKGNQLINYLKSCIFRNRSLNLVCVDNVVAALVFLGETERNVDGEVFIISDDNAARNNYRDVENMLIQKLSLKAYPVPRIPVPVFILGLLLKLAGRPQSHPTVKFSDQKLASFGFHKPMAFEMGVDGFVDGYRNNENT